MAFNAWQVFRQNGWPNPDFSSLKPSASQGDHPSKFQLISFFTFSFIAIKLHTSFLVSLEMPHLSTLFLSNFGFGSFFTRYMLINTKKSSFRGFKEYVLLHLSNFLYEILDIGFPLNAPAHYRSPSLCII